MYGGEGPRVLVVVWSSPLEFKLGRLELGSGYSVFRGAGTTRHRRYARLGKR